MATPMINGVSYSWSQIEVKFRDVAQSMSGLSSINYDDVETSAFNYGANNFPVSQGKGNVVSTGSITLHLDDVEALRKNILSGRLQDLGTFDVIVAYAHPDDDKKITHTLKGCHFSQNQVSTSQDDTVMEASYDLHPAHIFWSDSLIIGLGVV